MEQYIPKSVVLAEIERLIKKNELYLDGNASDAVRFQKTGAYSVLCDLRHFINTLEVKEIQEEPVSIWHDPSKETPIQYSNILMIRKEEGSDFPPIAGCFHGTNSRSDGRNWGYYNGFCYNEIEPPLKWAYVDDILKLSNVERTVKDWKEEPVSEDLEEAAIEICSKVLKGETITIDGYEYVVLSDAEECFKAGAEWQKQQTISKAYKWIDENAAKYLVDRFVGSTRVVGIDTSITEDFRKDMED